MSCPRRMAIPNPDQPRPVRSASPAPSSKAAPADARSPSCSPPRRGRTGPAARSPGCRRRPPAPGRREQRAGVGRVVTLLDHAQGDQHVGFLVGAAGAAGGRQGLVAPAAGLVALPGIDQRLGHGGGHPGPQPAWAAGRARARPPGRGRASASSTRPASNRYRPRRSSARAARAGSRGADGPGGVLGEARRPLVLAGGAGRRGRPQRQLDPVGAGGRHRVRHPLPQLQRGAQVAERLGRGQDRLGLLSRPHRRGQRTDQVVAFQAVVGQLGRGAVGLGREQAGVGGMQSYLLAWEQVAVDRLLQQRMAKRVASGGGVGPPAPRRRLPHAGFPPGRPRAGRRPRPAAGGTPAGRPPPPPAAPAGPAQTAPGPGPIPHRRASPAPRRPRRRPRRPAAARRRRGCPPTGRRRPPSGPLAANPRRSPPDARRVRLG